MDEIGTVRRCGTTFAIRTHEGEWFTTVPLGLQRWATDAEIAEWTVVYRPE